MLPSPLDSYVASAANFECWLWALCIRYVSLDCLHFFLPFYVTSSGLSCVWWIFLPSLFTIIFHVFTVLYFLWFAQYCLSKIPLLCMGYSDKTPTNKIWSSALSEQRPRTRSCHKSERLVWPFLGQTYLLESLFPDPVREQLGILASGDWRILCRVRSIKVSHVLLCLWLVPSHLTCLL